MKRAVSEKVTGQSTTPTAPKPNVKAAMLARRNKPADVPVQSAPRMIQETDEIPAYDDELSVALRALSPILHPTEKRRFADVLINPITRAASWKRRNR